MNLTDIPNWVPTVLTAVGSVGYLGRILGRMEAAFKAHTAEDLRKHKEVDSKIERLEKRVFLSNGK